MMFPIEESNAGLEDNFVVADTEGSSRVGCPREQL